MKYLFTFATLLLFSNNVFAQEAPGLKMTESTFEKTFKETVESVKHVNRNERESTLFEAALAGTSFDQLMLKNRYFNVEYQNS